MRCFSSGKKTYGKKTTGHGEDRTWPVATIVGLVQGITLTVLAVSLFFNPAATGAPINALTVASIIAVYALCFGLYFGFRAYRLRKEGIDVAWAFKELPPE